MPNPQPEAEQTKRPHYCSKLSTERNTERTERDADGCCKECGVPLDEEGYEAVDSAKEAQLKRLAANEPTMEDALAEVQDPELRAITERMMRHHGEPSPK